jgi:hypothetical protein
VAAHLAAWVRRRQHTHRMRRVSTHLDGCSPCQALAESLTKLNDELPALIAPVLLGVPAATAYLTTTTASTGLALAAKTGAATAPWITALKTTVAGAMIVTTVTTATITTVASNPPPAPPPENPTSP